MLYLNSELIAFSYRLKKLNQVEKLTEGLVDFGKVIESESQFTTLTSHTERKTITKEPSELAGFGKAASVIKSMETARFSNKKGRNSIRRDGKLEMMKLLQKAQQNKKENPNVSEKEDDEGCQCVNKCVLF